ncbi:hypothetical protein CANARDRAFT_212306 [[Candida] arabinofermentans NRRL YB-2248]|uniref:DUF2470 domain-containing protein n=1 Tax=[Candida] arabinofermentans NRRL YB-2248 TaxID=983967 RepID=A0A1E4T2P5_9ASCO|nr:hypothetical protein CANARDRAFT_212306 [[Candida] arabinofermentans NRRL YB-2248]
MFLFNNHSHSHTDLPVINNDKPINQLTDLQKAQAAILSKYNRSYRINLQDILNVYGYVKIDNNIANIRLRQVDLTSITIGFNHFDIEHELFKPIQFDNDLKPIGYSQVDDLIMDMAKTSAKKRGYSYIQVQTISSPSNIFELLLISFIILMVLGYYYPVLIFDKFFINIGIPIYICQLLKDKISLIYYTTIIIHLIELIIFMIPKLIYHRVPIDYFIEWCIYTLIEGFPAIKRFNKIVNKYEIGDIVNGFDLEELPIDAPLAPQHHR